MEKKIGKKKVYPNKFWTKNNFTKKYSKNNVLKRNFELFLDDFLLIF